MRFSSNTRFVPPAIKLPATKKFAILRWRTPLFSAIPFKREDEVSTP
jgi:hypothetical protein